MQLPGDHARSRQKPIPAITLNVTAQRGIQDPCPKPPVPPEPGNAHAIPDAHHMAVTRHAVVAALMVSSRQPHGCHARYRANQAGRSSGLASPKLTAPTSSPPSTKERPASLCRRVSPPGEGRSLRDPQKAAASCRANDCRNRAAEIPPLPRSERRVAVCRSLVLRFEGAAEVGTMVRRARWRE